MIYRAKDGFFYKTRMANKEDMLKMARVHSVSAKAAYEPFKDKYPVLYSVFSTENLIDSWKEYLKKCENNNRYNAIVIEKLYSKCGIPCKKIVGIAKASVLNGQYKDYMEEVLNKKMSPEEISEYANLQTIYIDPKYQGLGLGKSVMGYFANQFSEKGCKYALTETLSGYENSPKFFNKVGGATLLGEYKENTAQACVNKADAEEVIPLSLWLMNDMDKMKMTCYYDQQKVVFIKRKQEKAFQYRNMQLAYNVR